MIEGSRRGSVHTVQGFCVSMFPQVLQTWILSIATCSAAVSGVISASRFLIRCSAARRAERGPEPGQPRQQLDQPFNLGAGNAGSHFRVETKSRRQAEVRRSIAAIFSCIAASALRRGVAMRRDQQVLEHLALFRLHQRGIDLDALHFHLRGHAHRDQASAGDALDLDIAELLLHLLHLGLQLRCLLHHAEKISHACVPHDRINRRRYRKFQSGPRRSRPRPEPRRQGGGPRSPWCRGSAPAPPARADRPRAVR